MQPSSDTPSSQPPAGFEPPHAPKIQPESSVTAADVIRQKLDQIYSTEPSAKEEIVEADATTKRSVHQQFMHELSTSGKDLATIQTDWHNYYLSLPDTQKHQVWQEFYSNSAAANQQIQSAASTASAHHEAQRKHDVVRTPRAKAKHAKTKQLKRDLRSPQAIRSAIRDTVTANGKMKAKHHLQSLLFGLGIGTVGVFIFLFGFFNEVIIAPFIQPSRTSAATPVILDTASVATMSTPQVIIPKINVQIPVDYTLTTSDEASVQTALEEGVVHYPTTVKPGEQGNAAFFGHSSNNIFNKGKFKFAFVLLHNLVIGDTFYLSNGGKVYVYKVITKTVVEPSQIEVLGPIEGQTATATLITCDPPGTSLKRLVIVGQQISPDPSGNTAAAEQTAAQDTAPALTGKGPGVASRLAATLPGKAFIVVTILGLIIFTFRWMNKPRRR